MIYNRLITRKKSLLFFTINTARFLSTQASCQNFKNLIHNDFNYYNDKKSTLIYLKNLFDTFQRMIHVKHVYQHQWNRSLTLSELHQVRGSLYYVNNHVNFNLMRRYFIENFHQFDASEICLINRMFGYMEMNKLNSDSHEISQMLNNYLIQNIEKLNLSDYRHLAYRPMSADFLRESSDHVYRLLISENNDAAATAVEIEPEASNEFEREMNLLDSKNSYLWKKINVLRAYGKVRPSEKIGGCIANAFMRSTTVATLLYKVNMLNTLFATNTFMNPKSIKYDFLSSLLVEYLENLDLVYYKTDLPAAMPFLKHHNLLLKNEDFMIDYLKKKFLQEDNTVTKVEFFTYLNLFDSFVVNKMRKSNWKNDLNMRGVVRSLEMAYPIDFLLANDIKQKYYLGNSLEVDVKEAISRKYDKHIVDADVLCLKTLRYAIYTVYNVHYNQTGVLINLYKKILNYFDARHMQMLSSFTTTLIIGSNEATRPYERRLWESVSKIHVHSLHNTDFVRELCTVAMLNSETILKNYAFLIFQMENLQNESVFRMLKIFYLFDKHFEILIKNDKERSLKLFRILLEKIVNEFNCDKSATLAFQKHASIHLANVFVGILKQLKRMYLENVIRFNEYSELFSVVERIQLEEIVGDEKFEKVGESKYLQLYLRIASLMVFYKHGRHYSFENLHKIWTYLIQYLNHDSNTYNQDLESVFVDSIGMTMSVFNIFDFSNTDEYKQNIDLFRELNRKFYKKYRELFIDNCERLSMYARCLANLDCYISDVFDDLLQIYLSNPKQLRSKLCSHFPYMSIYYPRHKQSLRFALDEIFLEPNERFLKDFRTVFSSFVPVENQKSHVFRIGINSFGEFVPANDVSLKSIASIVLVDKIYCYQNSEEILRNISFNINCMKILNIPVIVVKEDEFYSKTKGKV